MTGKQRAKLRGMANTLETILYVGKEGVTDGTVKEAFDALEARELIKGCVQQGAPLDAKSALTILCEKTGAEPIQFIGRRFVMYRPSRENPRITIE
jgi:RNA-binding protein